jgi:hypothetical protein
MATWRGLRVGLALLVVGLAAYPAIATADPAAKLAISKATAAPVDAPNANSAFADWAAIVVAGDWHAHSGAPSEVFDNARRDIGKSLVTIGFNPKNIAQFSVRPERYPGVLATDGRLVFRTLANLSSQAQGGCLVYVTSHGAPTAVLFGNIMLPPAILAEILNRTCPDRPTVAVVSACFSGVFVNPMAAPDRMILTAARADRTSFGCGETDIYTYFDTCFLSEIHKATSFPVLATRVQACIASREAAEQVGPPSEPQLFIGTRARPVLSLLQFEPGPTSSSR